MTSALLAWPRLSVLVGDALYFDVGGIVECQLGALRLSVLKKPVAGKGCLMAAQDSRSNPMVNGDWAGGGHGVRKTQSGRS